MYLTYEQYINYGGTLDRAAFTDYEWEAETIINWFTFDRLKNDETFSEEVKRCAYKLIQLAQAKAEAMALGAGNGGSDSTSGSVSSATIASQSNDGVSITYNTVSATETFRALSSNAVGNIMEDTVQKYLQGVTNSLGRKVLYRGIYPNE